jgi:hypothetical protein
VCLFAWSEEPPEFHQKWMKDAGDLMGNLRKGVEVDTSAVKIATIMKEVEGFWAKRPSDVAVKSCQDTRSAAEQIASAFRASDKAGVSAGVKGVGAGCKACHDVHRERVSEGVYRIK